MTYLEIPGRWLREALLASKPPKEATRKFLTRCARRLETIARLDRPTVTQLLFSDDPVPNVPLFVVAILAREVRKSIEYLLIGSDSTIDPGLISTAEGAEITSANSFSRFLDRFDVPFPSVVWEYGFPAQRKGQIEAITFEQWIALYVERYGAEPQPRVN